MSGSDDTATIPVRRKRRWPLFLLLAFIIAGLAAGFAARIYVQSSFEAPGEFAETIFEVPEGAGINSVASKLEREGLIADARLYKLNMRFNDPDARLIPGEFRIPAGSSPAEITDTLKSGKVILYRFTAPEGLSVVQVMDLLDADPMLVDDDPSMPEEGTLLPETYSFPRGTTQSQIVAQMVAAHRKALDELWDARKPGLPVTTPREAVILASIVEKETGMDGERREVAGVFTNRLRRGMRLESDPTIIYGITKGKPLGRGIRRSEIDRKTDWNTYQIDGLPPTPIANPGREAIAAVLNPADTDAIFFVADGTGGHVFAKTYREHLRNVAKWRQIERDRRRRAAQQE